MCHYELEPVDVSDLLALIMSPSLSVGAHQVQRVAVLQAKLNSLQPLELVTKAEHAVACNARDYNTKRVAELEAKLTECEEQLVAERDHAQACQDALDKRITSDQERMRLE